MEFVVWYLGEESRAQELCESFGQGWPQVELSKFMGECVFIPLFSILIENVRPIGYRDIIDKHLYSQPSLEDEAKLMDGTAQGALVQRVNPELVSLLAAVSDSQIALLADKWFADPEMRDYYQRWAWVEQEARQEVLRILTELVPLTRRAVTDNKIIMHLSYL